MNGMDEGYKLASNWFHHGDGKSVSAVEGVDSVRNTEIFGLYEAATCLDEDLASKGLDLGEVVEGEDRKEDEFLAKLAEAETPLYPVYKPQQAVTYSVSL
ncbi:unnamed protein product [Microthlaspi erraticum]|uniref:Uncharacterized protein n=1 Tax=Microthlaspi erraticum TaxID=1685480 RepID=A0A6D2ISM6_9BRAS|nr:unnamed protein product [Microthlaspi erraticum]